MLYTLGLNFTMESWAESLALMSVIIHGPYGFHLKQTQLLCVIWQYRLWAVCPCLSWSLVAFSRSISVELVRGLARVKIWNVSICSIQILGHTYVSRHTHVSCNAVSLVWGLLSLAQTNSRWAYIPDETTCQQHLLTKPLKWGKSPSYNRW